MAKRVFFSFHYQDVIDFRANVVRQHWLTKPDREDAGYFDASIWEEARTQGGTALKRLINQGLDNTTVTCVLIGSQTYMRPWVRYEILKSYERGSKIIAIHINSIAGKDRLTKPHGPNPLAYVGVYCPKEGNEATLCELMNGQWTEYSQIGGSARISLTMPEGSRGRIHTMEELYPTCDWVASDGYNNFASWVE